MNMLHVIGDKCIWRCTQTQLKSQLFLNEYHFKDHINNHTDKINILSDLISVGK